MKNKGTQAITTIAFVMLIASFSNASAQQSPLSCGVQQKDINCVGLNSRTCQPIYQPFIFCDVTENNTKISDVVLNRGNCKSPKKQIEEQLAASKRLMQSEPQNAGIIKMLLTPDDPFAKTYNFGNRVEFSAAGCNLLEYTISVNGRDLTWKTR